DALVTRYMELTGKRPDIARVEPARAEGPEPNVVASDTAKAKSSGPPAEGRPAPGDARDSAREGFKLAMEGYREGRLGIDAVLSSAQRLRQSEVAGGGGPEGRKRAEEEHLIRLKNVEAAAKARLAARVGPDTTLDWLAARHQREEAERGGKAPGDGGGGPAKP